MIYYNACWLKRGTWWQDDNNKLKESYRYILDYALIKNIPLNLTGEFGPDAYTVYKDRLGKGPYFINEEEVTLQKKLSWLFESH